MIGLRVLDTYPSHRHTLKMMVSMRHVSHTPIVKLREKNGDQQKTKMANIIPSTCRQTYRVTQVFTLSPGTWSASHHDHLSTY